MNYKKKSIKRRFSDCFFLVLNFYIFSIISPSMMENGGKMMIDDEK